MGAGSTTAEGSSGKVAIAVQAWWASPAKPSPGRSQVFPGRYGIRPYLGRAVHAGVIGLGADPTARVEPGKGTDAIGVLGSADAAGVVGRSRTTGVIGDGRAGQHGVEGVGSLAGVYGHVDFANPNPDGA